MVVRLTFAAVSVLVLARRVPILGPQEEEASGNQPSTNPRWDMGSGLGRCAGSD